MMGRTHLLPYSAKHGITPFFLLLVFVHALSFSSAQRSPDPPAAVDPYANMKFSPSLAIIIVVLISALFFMGFFSIYIRHCSDSANGAAVRPAGANRSRRGAPRGLGRDLIDAFPTFVYSEVKTLKIGKGALECAVCLNEFEDDETLRLLPKCDHVFHPECIDAWLESHITCPVCRSNLAPESTPQPSELASSEVDLEAQNDTAVPDTPQETQTQPQPQPQGSQALSEPQVLSVNFANQTLNRNRTRGSRSGRPRRFPRSHSTGHSLIQPGEDTERFTLRLPVDVRKQIMMNRELNRSHSLLVLPREASSRRGYRTGGGEGSSRGRNIRWLDRSFKSDRWVFSKAPPFFQRASSLKSTKVAADDASSSVQPADSSRPPV